MLRAPERWPKWRSPSGTTQDGGEQSHSCWPEQDLRMLRRFGGTIPMASARRSDPAAQRFARAGAKWIEVSSETPVHRRRQDRGLGHLRRPRLSTWRLHLFQNMKIRDLRRPDMKRGRLLLSNTQPRSVRIALPRLCTCEGTSNGANAALQQDVVGRRQMSQGVARMHQLAWPGSGTLRRSRRFLPDESKGDRP